MCINIYLDLSLLVVIPFILAISFLLFSFNVFIFLIVPISFSNLFSKSKNKLNINKLNLLYIN